MNESSKNDVGLVLLKIFLTKFDKKVNFKYLKYFFKCIMSVTSKYANLIEIKFKKGCNKLVEVIDDLIRLFVINDPNYYSLNEKCFNINSNINELSPELRKAKENFEMLYDFIKYSFDEIVEKINTNNNYTRNVGIYLLNKILTKIPQIKQFLPILFQLDLKNLSIIDFFNSFTKVESTVDASFILGNKHSSPGPDDSGSDLIEIKAEKVENTKPIIDGFEKTKIYGKLFNIFNTLTKKLGIRENEFENLITNADALINLMTYCPEIVNEFIFGYNNTNMNMNNGNSSNNIINNNYESNNNKNNCELFLEVIKSIYINILLDQFTYCQVFSYFQVVESFKSKFIYLFMEQLLLDPNLEHEYKIKDNDGEEIIIKNEVDLNYIEYIEKYVQDFKIVSNVVNTRDNTIVEIFELLGLKAIMIQKFIKLLKLIFTNDIICKSISEKKDINHKSKEKENNNILIEGNNNYYQNPFEEIKSKTTDLIIILIFNRKTTIIIKECCSFLKEICLKDTDLKNEIYERNENKIIEILNEITKENIRDSNCALNQDVASGLQKEKIEALLILCKSLQFKKNIIKLIYDKLEIFNQFSVKEVQNCDSQLVLFYGFISLFLYIDDVAEEEIKKILTALEKKTREIILNPNRSLLWFTETKYRKKIIKLLTKHRKIFYEYIIKQRFKRKDPRYVYRLIRVLAQDEMSTLILESIMNQIVKYLQQFVFYTLIIEK